MKSEGIGNEICFNELWSFDEASNLVALRLGMLVTESGNYDEDESFTTRRIYEILCTCSVSSYVLSLSRNAYRDLGSSIGGRLKQRHPQLYCKLTLTSLSL